jgi:hypothetical protein
MLSSHIDRGRRNLCAAFARQLRAHGLATFQAALLPSVAPDLIAQLNQRGTASELACLDVAGEIDRVLSVAEERGEVVGHAIHFVGDVADVAANVWAWNAAMVGEQAAKWHRRRAQFFVFEPRQRDFAPAKFCAFVPLARSTDGSTTMTLDLYTSLGARDPRFDGHRAHEHLSRALGFARLGLATAPRETREAFARWHERHGTAVPLQKDVQLLTPPSWYR